MPNYVINKLTLNGSHDDIRKLMDFVRDEQDETPCNFSFDNIIPMPDSLAIEDSTNSNKSLRWYLRVSDPSLSDYGYQKLSVDEMKSVKEKLSEMNLETYGLDLMKSIVDEECPEDLDKKVERGKILIDNLIQYGATTWYPWCVINWGTKWNCWDVVIHDENVIEFYTAWSAPVPVICKLAEMFPTIDILHQWADECIGENLGEHVYRNGKLDFEWDTDSAGLTHRLKFANELWGLSEEDE